MHSNKTHHAVYLLKGPVLFSNFFILSEWAKPFLFINVSDPIRTFLSHFYHISIIFYICKIYHISVCEYWIYGYLWEKNEGHWTKKSEDVFFFRIKVKVRILRKTKQNNRSTLFFFTVALTLFHTYQRIYYMILLWGWKCFFYLTSCKAPENPLFVCATL